MYRRNRCYRFARLGYEWHCCAFPKAIEPRSSDKRLVTTAVVSTASSSTGGRLLAEEVVLEVERARKGVARVVDIMLQRPLLGVELGAELLHRIGVRPKRT